MFHLLLLMTSSLKIYMIKFVSIIVPCNFSSISFTAVLSLPLYFFFCDVKIFPTFLLMAHLLDIFNEECYYHRMYNVCFQTGTLTEDGLDMRGVVPVSQAADKVELSPMTSAGTLPHDHLLFAMATCHSITVINLKKVSRYFILLS